MIIEFADFVSSCPYFEGTEIMVNCLGQDCPSVSVEATKSKRQLREYADGGDLETETFVVALRESFGVSDEENRKVAKKCCLIEKWFEEQNSGESFLQLGDGRLVVSLEIVKKFEIVRTEGNSARYEAEVEIIYYKN